MTCPQVKRLINAYLDGELDAANTLQVDEHLADCPACFDEVRRLSALHSALQKPELRFAVPAGLHGQIVAAVNRAAGAERESSGFTMAFLRSGWAAAVALLIVSVFAVRSVGSRDEDRRLAELTASHVRSLMVDHLTDVASTDQHTVKPWFNGKLEFAPPVKDLRDLGFPLLGGRLDFVDGHPAAALVYGRQKHFLNLFVWPAESAQTGELRAFRRNGYNLLQWADGGMSFSVVSDLNETELRQFVKEWRAK
jgi:anti-sigma factor RsiW